MKACTFIFVCHGKDCLKQGAKILKKQLNQEVKNHKGIKNIQVIKSKCLDRCKFAPSVVCGHRWYGKVKVKDLTDIINDSEY